MSNPSGWGERSTSLDPDTISPRERVELRATLLAVLHELQEAPADQDVSMAEALRQQRQRWASDGRSGESLGEYFARVEAGGRARARAQARRGPLDVRFRLADRRGPEPFEGWEPFAATSAVLVVAWLVQVLS